MLRNLKELQQQTQSLANQVEISKPLVTGAGNVDRFLPLKKLKYFPIFALSVLLMGGTIGGIPAQAIESRGLLMAEGNSLSRSEIDQVIAFFEWAFAAKFTPDQRSEYHSIKLAEFSKDPEGTRKGVNDLIANYQQVITKSEAEQNRVRQGFSGGFVAELRKLPDDAEAKLLLAVYEHTNSETASNHADDSSGSVGDISSIVGKWVWGRSGSSSYGASGAYLGSNGSRFTYQFRPDGTVEYTGIMNVMNAGCNQQVFQARKGKVSLNGSTMTINWSPATFTRDFSCDTAHNYTKTLPAERETYQVNVKSDLGQRQLCLTAKEETCYSPTN
jgi:hypothetical protein